MHPTIVSCPLENYAKFYFDAKHLEKGQNKGGEIFSAVFFKCALFGQYCMLPEFSRLKSFLQLF